LIEFAPPRQLHRYTAPLFENSKRTHFWHVVQVAAIARDNDGWCGENAVAWSRALPGR